MSSLHLASRHDEDLTLNDISNLSKTMTKLKERKQISIGRNNLSALANRGKPHSSSVCQKWTNRMETSHSQLVPIADGLSTKSKVNAFVMDSPQMTD